MASTILEEIVDRVRARLAEDKKRWPLEDLKRRVRDADPVRSFAAALQGPFGLIAEIKRCSPSQGQMRFQNVEELATIYEKHSFVRAISVLTNRDDFQMGIEQLRSVRAKTNKPILRKDFILDEYQVYEARVNGADAVLLMANVVKDHSQMRGLFALATSLKMDVLFECRNQKEINGIPYGAKIYGINSRKMAARKILGFSRYSGAQFFANAKVDHSIELPVFQLAKHIPKRAIKIAESGLNPSEIAQIRDEYHYNAALVGTAILNHESGPKAALDAFSSQPESQYRLHFSEAPAQCRADRTTSPPAGRSLGMRLASVKAGVL